MLIKFLPQIKEVQVIWIFGYLLRQVALYGRKRGLEVGDCFAVTLVKVGIKPVEKSVTSPIVLPSLSYEEQGFVHIILAFVDDTLMMKPWNKE